MSQQRRVHQDRRSKRIRYDEETSDNDTSSQSDRRVSSDKAQEDRLVSDLVTYMLIMDQTKYAIKRQDIVKNVLKEKASLFSTVLDNAKQKLLQVFGIKVVELQDKKGHYMLVNALTPSVDTYHLMWSEEQSRNLGLLTVILCIIFMNGNAISENDLWAALKKTGINKESFHDEFKDVKKLILKTFTRQLYLECKRVPNSDPPITEITWGPRAKEELSKLDLLQFVCEIYGDVTPEKWTSQYEDAQNDTRN